MDNELSDEEASRLIKAIRNDSTLAASWDTFHQVGDALRSIEPLSNNFQQRFAQRLADEPTILAPQRERSSVPVKRFPYPMVAAVAAVSLVGILSVQIARVNLSTAPAQVADTASQQTPAKPIVVAQATLPQPADKQIQVTAATPRKPAQVKFSRAASDAYMLAHQEFSPNYAPTYVRVVSAGVDANQ